MSQDIPETPTTTGSRMCLEESSFALLQTKRSEENHGMPLEVRSFLLDFATFARVAVWLPKRR